MAYIGNTNTTQAFTPAVDYFNGNGSTTAFTLSRPVASVAQVQAVIENVPQNPGDAFTVSGNTITFTSAPPSGTQNIYVYYTSPITQVIAPSQGTVGTAQLQDGAVITQDIADSAVTTAKIADANVTIAKLSATGTPSSSTYLRGDNTWAAVSGGVTSLNGQTGSVTTTSLNAIGSVYLSSDNSFISGGSINGGTTAGSNLNYFDGSSNVSAGLSGTWRALGAQSTSRGIVYMRVS